MEIKAAVVFEQSGNFSIEQLQLSDPNDDEVLVQIAGSSRSQSADIAQINHAVEQMETANHQNAELMAQAAGTAGELKERARELRGLVEYFRVE